MLRYAVLASVSGRYSPPEGRLLTCYSPVRHFMHSPKRVLIVRLACLRHAASVDSEPGSNSRLKVILVHLVVVHELTHGHAYLVFKNQALPSYSPSPLYAEAKFLIIQARNRLSMPDRNPREVETA